MDQPFPAVKPLTNSLEWIASFTMTSSVSVIPFETSPLRKVIRPLAVSSVSLDRKVLMERLAEKTLYSLGFSVSPDFNIRITDCAISCAAENCNWLSELSTLLFQDDDIASLQSNEASPKLFNFRDTRDIRLIRSPVPKYWSDINFTRCPNFNGTLCLSI